MLQTRLENLVETARVCWLQDLVLYSKLRLGSVPQIFQTSNFNFLVNDMSSTQPQCDTEFICTLDKTLQ